MKAPRVWAVAVLLGLVGCDDMAMQPTQAALALEILPLEGVSLVANQVRLRIQGPSASTRTVQPGQTVTIGGLAPGAYTVSAEGLVGSDVEWFDRVTVSVAEGETVTRSMTARSFVPGNVSVATAVVEAGEPFAIRWNPLEHADEYLVEQANNTAFAGAESRSVTGTSLDPGLSDLHRGTFYFRVRGVNAFGSQSLPSAVVSVDVLPPYPFFCPSVGSAFADLQGAIDAASTDGTVEICSGTHTVEGVTIAKPLTLRAAPDATPLLRTSTAPSTLFVGGFASGTVTIDGLSFELSTPTGEIRSYAIRAREVWDRLEVRNSTFTIDPQSRGSIAGEGSVPGASLLIENTNIEGGQWGVAMVDLTATLSEISIHGTAGRALAFTGTTGSVTSSSFSSCSMDPPALAGDPDREELPSCVIIQAGSNVSLVGNTLMGDHQRETDGRRAVVYVLSGSEAIIQRNVFDVCGFGQCVTGHGGARVEVVENRFELPDTETTANERTGHVLLALSPGTELHARNNEAVGLDLDGDPQTYATRYGAFAANQGGVMFASGNTITNAVRGFSAFAFEGPPGTIAEATDNTLRDVGVAFWVQSQASISARFNDIDGAAVPVEVGDYTTLDLTCNWWGSPDGPQGVPSSLPSTVYTPWADAQIAGTGTTDCTGGTATGPAVDAYAPDRSMRLEARPAATTAPRSDGGF